MKESLDAKGRPQKQILATSGIVRHGPNGRIIALAMSLAVVEGEATVEYASMVMLEILDVLVPPLKKNFVMDRPVLIGVRGLLVADVLQHAVVVSMCGRECASAAMLAMKAV